ncbi:hypothetical protein KAT72_19130 [Aeromonas popoffii]|uniref:Uncharacterized protein n=1 Tax=Aeromonas popoffii TaxID=70856 RepID=A0ABS5GVA3_9GAMM|nr:hypothetical protein [Aeromonas popoffii]MBR7631071.1 hypothetical protein [Aeromonas popoffii]
MQNKQLPKAPCALFLKPPNVAGGCGIRHKTGDKRDKWLAHRQQNHLVAPMPAFEAPALMPAAGDRTPWPLFIPPATILSLPYSATVSCSERRSLSVWQSAFSQKTHENHNDKFKFRDGGTVSLLVPRHRPGWQALAGGKRAHAGAAATPATVTRGGDMHAIFMGDFGV